MLWCFCKLLTEWGEVAIAILDGNFRQIQMAVKYLVVLNGKELIAVARGNLIQELVFGQNRKDVPVSIQNLSF